MRYPNILDRTPNEITEKICGHLQTDLYQDYIRVWTQFNACSELSCKAKDHLTEAEYETYVDFVQLYGNLISPNEEATRSNKMAQTRCDRFLVSAYDKVEEIREQYSVRARGPNCSRKYTKSLSGSRLRWNIWSSILKSTCMTMLEGSLSMTG